MKKYLLIALIACSSVGASKNNQLPIQKSSLSISQFGGVSVLGGINLYADERAYFHNQTTIVYQRRLYKGLSIVGNLGINTWRDQNTYDDFDHIGLPDGIIVMRNTYHFLCAGIGFNISVPVSKNNVLNFKVVSNINSIFSSNSVVAKAENLESPYFTIRQDYEENHDPSRIISSLSPQFVFNPNITGRFKKLRLRKELRWQAGLYGAFSMHNPDIPYTTSAINNLTVGLQLGLVYAW